MKGFIRQRVVLGWAVLLSFSVCFGDDLDVARNALQDRLYAVAQAHAERTLRDASSDEAQSASGLLILAEALFLQEKPQAVLDALAAYAGVVGRASEPEAFAYWQASALLASGQAGEAARVATEASAKASSYADALRRVGARARQAMGDLPGALTLFAAVDQTSTNAVTRADNALEWAMALEGAGRDEAAIAVLGTQAALGVQNDAVSRGNLLRGRLLMRMGKPAEAGALFSKLVSDTRVSEPVGVQALVELSAYAFSGGKTNEALAYARSAYTRATQPETRRLAGFRLGDLLSADAGTIDEGERLVKALVREFPESSDSMRAQLKMADALLQAHRPEQAAAEYRIFLETYPSSALDVHVLQGRGWALFQLGRFTESSGMFQKAAEGATNDAVRAECRLKQGDALLADGRFRDASDVYAKLAQALPRSVYADRALFQSADALERAGLRADACAQYRRVAEAYPDRAVASQALLRLAALQAEANEHEEALRTYTSLLGAAHSKDVRIEAWMGRGKVYYRMFRFDAAMQDFAAVAETDPARRDEARFLLTLCLYGLGRDKEARAAAASFLLDFPESVRLPDMMLWLGKFDFNRGRFADARRFFSDYVSRWPTNAWSDAALLWSARAAFNETDYTGAVEGVTRLVREYPKSARLSEARLVQADALMELARFDEAVLLLDQILAQTQESVWQGEALLRKGDCLFALGTNTPSRYKDALYAYRERLVQDDVTPALALQLHYKIARCLEKLKRLDEAIDEYYAEVMIRYQNARAQGGWPDEADTSLYVRAAFNVADLYEQKGQPEQAVRVLQRLLQAGVPGHDEARQRIERLRKKRQ